MAEKRMFTQKIIDSDPFLDMPLSTQALYFHLNMRADDDGFVNSPKKICRSIGASDDDLKLLLAKRFLIGFESGVLVIKHWRMHNTLRKDRYNPTQYQEEYAMLDVKDNKAYTEKRIECLATTWQPNGNQLATQYSIDKNSIVEDSIEELEAVSVETEPPKKRKKQQKVYADDPELNSALLAFVEFRKSIKKPMTDHAVKLLLTKLHGMSNYIPEQIEILNQSIVNGWQGIFPLKDNQPVRQGGYHKPTKAEELDQFYKMASEWSES